MCKNRIESFKTSRTQLNKASRIALPMLLGVFSLALGGCNGQQDDNKPTSRYEATITRTSYGIPHITADSWGALGFGEAYSAAEDQVCNMAMALTQSRGESAKAFGAGPNRENVARDIVIKALGMTAQAPSILAQQNASIREWIEGYTAGYNQFLAEHSESLGSWCHGAPWVRPVTTDEFMAQYLTLLYTLPRVAGALTAASLPLPDTLSNQPSALVTKAPALLATLNELKQEGMGSNAWALASERTENGQGILLANPHYPWYGIARFWEKHLTIPGVLDVYGVGLIGAPGVTLGFNDAIGWSHTVSNSKRTVIYQLSLNPDNPKQYRWGDDWRELEPTPVTVEVSVDGKVSTLEHTLWASHHGPLIALPGLAATPYTVFAIRDANAGNTQTLAQWQAMAQATSMDDLINAHRRYNAMPWVNTIATSASGRAVYIDNSNVGALSDDAIRQWQGGLEALPKLRYLYLTQGLVILDGSQAMNDWLATGAPVPDTEPFERRPLIESDQYVFNANDSYWLSDPGNPALPVSPLYGPTHSPRSLRTRMNIELLRSDSPMQYAGPDGKFSITEVQAALFGNDSLAAQLLLPDLLSSCEARPSGAVAGQTVDLTAACSVLARWNKKMDLDSKGAVLFREWLTRYPYEDTYIGGALFLTPFDPALPATTPAGLGDSEIALNRLAEAVVLLAKADIALDTPLGDLQRGHRMDEIIPLHGGNRYEGIANLQVTNARGSNQPTHPVFTGSTTFVGDSKTLSESGYNILHGSSFIMTLGFDETGPTAEAILSYSQSGDPTSPHFTDQTYLYKDKQWRPILFSPEAIAGNTLSTRVLRSSP